MDFLCRDRYSPIPLDDNTVAKESKSKWRGWSIKVFNLARNALAVAAIILICIQIVQSIPSRPRPCFCGRTLEEASLHGCKFDPFALAWVPDHCRDDELIAAYHKLGEEQGHHWHFRNYPDNTTDLSMAEVSHFAGDPMHGNPKPGKVITTVDWHHTHCLYLIEKQLRLPETGLAMTSRYKTAKHLSHCMNSLMLAVAAEPVGEELLESWELQAWELQGFSEVDMYHDAP